MNTAPQSLRGEIVAVADIAGGVLITAQRYVSVGAGPSAHLALDEADPFVLFIKTPAWDCAAGTRDYAERCVGIPVRLDFTADPAAPTGQRCTAIAERLWH